MHNQRKPDQAPGPNRGFQLPRSWGLAVSVLCLGLLVGLSSGLLARFFELTQAGLLGFTETPEAPTAEVVPPIRRLASVTIAGLVAGLVWAWLRTGNRLVPSVGQAVKGAPMPPGRTVVHVLTQIFFVAAGGSIGREVAPREAGALLGGLWTRLGRRLGLRDQDGPLLVASAAGAGFAGIYIAPLTGAFFGIEVLLRRVDAEVVTVNLAMSALATLAGGSIKGFGPYYKVGSEPFRPWLMAVVLFIGPAMGLLGAGFRRMTSWAEAHRTNGPAAIWQLTGIALLTGLVALAVPQVMGNGRALAQMGMDQRLPSGFSGLQLAQSLALLALFALAKALLTTATIRAGAFGGTLTPSIALGSAMGAVLGLMLACLVPGLPVWQCAVIGAASLLAASQQAPLMAMAMLMEVCHLPVMAFMPMGLAVALSMAVSRLFVARS
ncbi:chloride channel protein [Bifidobacterium sp. 7101]|uniref:chloride channel protein n=1 Tax=Bifidobacterium sp. 7101 TaxID=1394175 RepID=UPI00040EF3D9|nr:chloride channel protein [Bifidobacterium sp. 7101]